jgi:hypothetical protein
MYFTELPDEHALKVAWRHYNSIREKYHTKRAEISNHFLRLAKS